MGSPFRPTVEEVSINDIRPYPKNAKVHTRKQINGLAKQIQEIGYDVPIVVDKDGVIIKGHARFEALKKLKRETVQVIRRSDLSEEQVRASRLADNRLAESEWDMDLVTLELHELQALDFDLELTGFADDDIPGLNADETEEERENIYTSKVESPVYQPKGDRPAVSSLYSTEKTDQLIREISSVEKDLPADVREFLINAAQRHTVFNYQNIAEYYCHAPKNIQTLMENSALVIIDFKRAIELGFVQMTKSLGEVFREEKEFE